jgi:hypothetical protein
MKAVLRALRKLLRLPAPKISRQQAIEIALAELTRRSSAPLQTQLGRGPLAREGLKDWTVLLDPDFKPCRRMIIDNQTGEIVKYVSLPR